VVALAFSSTGERLLSAGGRTAAFWDLTSTTLSRRVSGPQVLTVGDLAEDNRTAYFGTDHGSMLRWDTDQSTAQPLPDLACPALALPAPRLQLAENRRCPFGRYVETDAGLRACLYPVTALSLHRGLLARACREGALHLRDLGTGRQRGLSAGYLRTLTPVEPGHLLFGRGEGELRLYDPQSGKVVRELQPSGAPDAAASMGDLIAVAQRGAIRVWAGPAAQAAAAVAAPRRAVWLGWQGSPLEIWSLSEDGNLAASRLTVQR
jgi:hypothetical protein